MCVYRHTIFSLILCAYRLDCKEQNITKVPDHRFSERVSAQGIKVVTHNTQDLRDGAREMALEVLPLEPYAHVIAARCCLLLECRRPASPYTE